MRRSLYSFQNKTIKKLHLGLTWNCFLECPYCARIDLDKTTMAVRLEKGTLEWDQYKDLLNIDSIEEILLCGNYGDPIYYKHLLALCEYIKTKNTNTKIIIHTNGSSKHVMFWESLGYILNNNDTVIFSIDGSFANSNVYRINSKHNTILTGIKTLLNSVDRPNIKWKHLIFGYNISTIEDAIDQAILLGFDSIEFTKSITDDNKTYSINWSIQDIITRIEKKFNYLLSLSEDNSIFNILDIDYNEDDFEKWIRLNLTYFQKK